MVEIIAEAGVNHNGSVETAFKLVDLACEAGVDTVKFQVFKAHLVVTSEMRMADYQRNNTGSNNSQFEMLKNLELSFDEHQRIKAYCDQMGVGYLATAFDNESLEFLIKDLGLQKVKIGSGEITNLPFLLNHSQYGCDIVLSTGIANLAEIEMALSVLAYGFTVDQNKKPSLHEFSAAYASQAGKAALHEKVTLLHCTSEYPAPFHEINLQAINTLSQTYGLRTGFSDHSSGIYIPIAAVSIGAKVIEKHFTLDRLMEGPDHKASLGPEDLIEMVTAIRCVEVAQGNGRKFPSQSEMNNKSKIRKKVVAATNIEKGEIITEEKIKIIRSEKGDSPVSYWTLIGTKAKKNIAIGDGFG